MVVGYALSGGRSSDVATEMPQYVSSRESLPRNWTGALPGRFPTNGWYCWWVGDPDLGDSWQQPGGWMHNVLPYMEQQPLHDLQLGKSGQSRKDAATQMV